MRRKTNPDRVSFAEKVSYGLGDLSASLAWNAAAAFALFFYTDVALLPAAAIGTLFLFTRIFDAGFDIAIGLAVDRTRTKWGQARPYLLFAALPFGVLTVLTFVTPDASQSVRLLYAGATYFLLGLLLSVTNIPFSAMLPMMTTDLKEKLDLSAARSMGTSVGVILVTSAFLPAVAALGGEDQRRGFFLTALIVGIVSTALLLVTFANCRERHTIRPDTSRGIAGDVAAMFKNQAWLSVAGFATLNFIRFGAILALTPYFAINVLGKPWMISVLMPTLSGTLLLGAFFAPPILRRLGMRVGNTIALLLAAALYVVLPFCADAAWAFTGIYVAASLSLSVTMTATYAMASDSVDYHQWRFGERNEGLLAAGVAFAIKVGIAIGTAGVAYGLAIGGYDPQNVTPRAREVMSWLYYGIPLAVFALQIACMQFYPVDRYRDEIAAALKPAHD